MQRLHDLKQQFKVKTGSVTALSRAVLKQKERSVVLTLPIIDFVFWHSFLFKKITALNILYLDY